MSGTDFEAFYWQCFDDFIKITIDENTESTFFEAKKMTGNYSDFADCDSKKCPSGNCQCDDSIEEKAKAKCGQSFVSQKPTEKPISPPGTKSAESDLEIEILDILEFQCLSYDMENKFINDVNSDLSETAESECKELEMPKDTMNAECPVEETSCDLIIIKDDDKDKFGFYSCSCDSKCSYACADSDYEPVFPDEFDQETCSFTTYTCKKDKNIVMIVCTSIFVPLGVAGIAAGVYYFFFHSSSEVAPVETDTELGNKDDDTNDDDKADKTDNESEKNNEI